MDFQKTVIPHIPHTYHFPRLILNLQTLPRLGFAADVPLRKRTTLFLILLVHA